jgi:hypothetical protein
MRNTRRLYRLWGELNGVKGEERGIEGLNSSHFLRGIISELG